MSKNNVNKDPLVSVIMATYNGERFIAEAIQSVLDQTFKDFEFIIVDDGSTDTTEQLISSYQDQRIVYIKKENNTGIADSLNIGIDSAKGDYIARMDDDDVCMSTRLEKQLKVFSENDKLILCGTSVFQKGVPEIRINPEKHEDIKTAMLFKNPITHPTVMFRNELLSNYSYDANMVPSEDYDLWSRLIFEGEFYNIREPLLFYRYHKKSETATRREEQLNLNVKIAQTFFKKVGFDTPFQNEYIKIIASHDYSISGRRLKVLLKWLHGLIQFNKANKLLPEAGFNETLNKNIEKYLLSYFTNKTIINKIVPFLYLNIAKQKLILNYYFSKLKN